MKTTTQDELQRLVSLKREPLSPIKHKLDMSSVATVILGGGQGSRLFPLTKNHCKPSMLFGGRYRLIDVPISNSLHAGITQIFVLTQFLSRSLHRHIFQTYRQDHIFPGSIEILSAEQRPGQSDWFQGTADAVRQNADYLLETSAEYFLILSGDQLYHIDFEKLLRCAQEQPEVDVWVATLTVSAKDATRMGIMKVNEDNHIIDFYEKPNDPLLLERMKTPKSVLDKMECTRDENKQFLGSMGIYLFRRSTLFDLLKKDPREDFGKHLIPSQVKKGRIGAFIHDGYWEDIGTIESFYYANLELNQEKALFSCHTENAPLYTAHSHLPGPRIVNAHIRSSTICEGSVILADEVTNSLLGQRTILKRGAVIRDSYIMGNSTSQKEALSIGENCFIKKAIIDKNVSIGDNVRIVNRENYITYDGDPIHVRDGIVVISEGAVIPDNFIF